MAKKKLTMALAQARRYLIAGFAAGCLEMMQSPLALGAGARPTEVFSMIGAFGTALFFALTAVFANRAAKLLGSTAANLCRLLLATAILGAWAHIAGMGWGGVSASWFFASGLAGFGLGGVAMFMALPRLGSNLAMLIVQCGAVFVAAAVEWVWLGSPLTMLQIGFALITLEGVVVGLLPRSLPQQPSSVFRAGVVWAVISAAGQGFGAVLSRKAFMLARAAHEAPDVATTAYQRACGGLLVALLAVAIARAMRRKERAISSGDCCCACPDGWRLGGALRTAWPWVFANALTGPVLGVTCYQWALSSTHAGIVQPIVATSPLLTIPLAARLEGGWPRFSFYVGAVLAVSGVVGLYLAR